MASGRKSPVETEIKLAFPSAAAARRALRLAGFRLHIRRGFESNTLFDFPDGSLREKGVAIRHRMWRGEHTVTYKGPAQLVAGTRANSEHKQRLELETVVGEVRPIIATWEAAGLRPSFRYEKYRSIYTREREPGQAMLDETPLGIYLELEGTGSWIDRSARLLGCGPERYIQLSYPALQAERCRLKRIAFCDLLFKPPSKTT